MEPASSEPTLLARVLDQNDRLIGILARVVEGSNPAALIAALNPPAAAPGPEMAPDYFQADLEPQRGAEDPWGDEKLTTERLLHGRVAGGFIAAPEAPTGATEETPLPLARLEEAAGGPTAAA